MRLEHKAVPIALAAVLIDTIGFGIVAPVFPALLRSLGETDIEQATRIAGWMLVVYAGAQFLAGPVLGNQPQFAHRGLKDALADYRHHSFGEPHHLGHPAAVFGGSEVGANPAGDVA